MTSFVALAVFAIVLVAVYAVKAWAIASKHSDLAEKSTSFSWVRPEPLAEGQLAPWLVEEQRSETASRTAVARIRRAGHVGA